MRLGGPIFKELKPGSSMSGVRKQNSTKFIDNFIPGAI